MSNLLPQIPILRPGDTCWRIEPSDRAAFLIDADAYFRALRAAILAAERSVLILGWEFHSRVRLVPEAPEDGLPAQLDELLLAAVAARPELEVRILLWDFAVIYAFEREFLPSLSLPWRRHPRIDLRMDNDHPLGASHHQKLVVIDDRLAFCGGLDVTANRWDTSDHDPDDPRRVNPDGNAYRPFHDVQMMVDGPAAAALGALARDRWGRATGQAPAPAGPAPATDPWPCFVIPDLRGAPIAIARTEPAWRDRPEVREVERLFIESIRSARRSIYIENQYFTSEAVGAALADSLEREAGPDIVVVVPHTCCGWLEEAAMGVARARLFRRLREADRHGRLATYHPIVPGGTLCTVNLHSKVMVVDDRLARIGSANLANRSMGLDTECDLAIDHAEGAARLRNRLLAEHLGTTEAAVAVETARAGGRLIAAIEALRGMPRTLVAFEPQVPELLDALMPDTSLLDPERPVILQDLVTRLLPPGFGGAVEPAADAAAEPARNLSDTAAGR